MTTTLKRCQYLDGFILVGPAKNVVSMPAAAVSIARGDMLQDDGNGYITNASITAFASDKVMYVAIEPCDNSGGSVGDLNVLCVPISDSSNEWWVPVGTGSVIARTDVGTMVDLYDEDSIDVDTAVTNVGYCFCIEGFDAGTAAVAANTYGYARGRFQILGETT